MSGRGAALSTSSTMTTFPIEKYKLEDHLGYGAFSAFRAYGTVSQYKRRDGNGGEHLPQRVAVYKTLLPIDSDNFSTELQQMAKVGTINPPNIVKFFGSCQLERGRVGLVMEIFHSDLLQHLSSPCSVSECHVFLKQIARALKCLHQMEIVHGYINPDKVLIRTSESGEIQVAVSFLGVTAHMKGYELGIPTHFVTLWMAPEVKGDSPTYGHGVDVYGFGLTAMYLLTQNFPLGKDVEGTHILYLT